MVGAFEKTPAHVGREGTLNQAYIFLGSNIERRNNYLEALTRLRALGNLAAASSVYETAPVGSHEGRDFYNGSVLLETDLGARDLKRALRLIEQQMGRTRTEDRNSPRTIDLDLVLFNHEQIDEPGLTIPDPLIVKRPFLASTLAELDPEYVHPSEGRTLTQIARSLGDDPGEMRLEPGMSALVRQTLAQIYTGEISHA